MKSRRLFFFSATLLLTLAIWWLNFSITIAQGWWFSLFFIPLLLVIAGAFLTGLAIKCAMSGMLIVSIPTLGTGLLMGLGLLTRNPMLIIHAWPVLVTLAAAGILLENHLGIGWRYTDHQAYKVVALSILAFLVTNAAEITLLQGLIDPGAVTEHLNVPLHFLKGIFSIQF